MNDFKKIFSQYGYSLFEESSIEKAIIEAIKNNEIRYILGIPLLLENAEINYKNLLEMATKEKLLDMLLEILSISIQVIKNKGKKSALKKLLSGRKIKLNNLDESEFRQIYEQYSKASQMQGFRSGLNYYLSFIFAPRQIEILYKIQKGEKLKKTEKEYYSRTIKKRLISIRELFDFTKEILVKD
ncbi:MAG: hypothetical protein Q7S22_03360 [Candidatus Micrarchaeota archaeon]|nr:hypothetical protein [Candidatus Micrarchaeota archaeon]